MRRVISVLLASTLLIVMATPVAADATPVDERRQRVDVPLSDTFVELGPEYCGFPLTVEDISGKVTHVFITEDRHGNVLERRIFHTVAEYTNLDTGASFQRRYDSVVNVIIRPSEGTAKVILRNDALVWYLDGEPSELGPGVWLIDKGRVVEEFHFELGLTSSRVDEAAEVFDVCAMLS